MEEEGGAKNRRSREREGRRERGRAEGRGKGIGEQERGGAWRKNRIDGKGGKKIQGKREGCKGRG